MLVGAPGIGKQVVEDARDIWTHTKRPGSKNLAFYVASDSATRASLMDELGKAKQTFLPPSGPPLTYHSLAVIQEEFQVLLPTYDREFVSRLNRLYMAPDQHSESRRTGQVRELLIENPILNLLVAAQPAYLADTFPENAWATGIARRLLMIYAAEGPLISIFTEPPDRAALRTLLISRFEHLSTLFGHARWHASAAKLVEEFEMDSKIYLRGERKVKPLHPVPSHSRLVYYNESRAMILIKLSIACAVAARAELLIEKEDVERGLTYLLAAEGRMPDIFREMRGQSDREVMEELHNYALATYAKSKKLRTHQLIDFLSYRVPGDKIPRIMLVVEQANLLARLAGTSDLWIPKPSHTVKGVE